MRRRKKESTPAKYVQPGDTIASTFDLAIVEKVHRGRSGRTYIYARTRLGGLDFLVFDSLARVSRYFFEDDA